MARTIPEIPSDRAETTQERATRVALLKLDRRERKISALTSDELAAKVVRIDRKLTKLRAIGVAEDNPSITALIAWRDEHVARKVEVDAGRATPERLDGAP